MPEIKPIHGHLIKRIGLFSSRVLCRNHTPYNVGDISDNSITLMTLEATGKNALLSSFLDENNNTIFKISKEITRRIVFDATTLSSQKQLSGLYTLFNSHLKILPDNSRIVVVARVPEEARSPTQQALRQGLEGFTRSIAKEVGRKGCTANIIYLYRGGERWLAGPIHFLLSSRSAFITGQPWFVSDSYPAEHRFWRIASSQPLKGKTALVTGAAQGLGEAMALRLAEEGARVIAVDLPSKEGALIRLCRITGGNALTLDIADQRTVAEILSLFMNQEGGGISLKHLDIVIHNAGIIRDRTMTNMSLDQWNTSIEVNLSAIMRIDKALTDNGFLADHGRLIYLSSIAGIAGNVGQANYALCKAAMMGYAAAQAKRLAPHGITANAIAPGLINTPMMNSMPWLFREIGKRMNSLKQPGIPRDVAELATFLCTPTAAGINGQTLRVCGQHLMGA